MRLHYVVACKKSDALGSGAGKEAGRRDVVIRIAGPIFGDDQRIRGYVDLSVQSKALAKEALDAGADVIVAQGHEAGGHSGSRSTLTLVAEVADLLRDVAPETLVVAAGGVADGRALAACLMLGADGVLVGSRLLASQEALIPDGLRQAILAADGDSTVKTSAIDVVRGYDWPGDFSARALKNRFLELWHGREADLAEAETNAVERERYWKAFHSGDADNAGVMVSEAVGLIRDAPPAGIILERMVSQAERLLEAGRERLVATTT